MTNKEKTQIKNIIEHSKRKTNNTPLTFHNIFTKEQIEYIKKIDVKFWYLHKGSVKPDEQIYWSAVAALLFFVWVLIFM